MLGIPICPSVLLYLALCFRSRLPWTAFHWAQALGGTSKRSDGGRDGVRVLIPSGPSSLGGCVLLCKATAVGQSSSIAMALAEF